MKNINLLTAHKGPIEPIPETGFWKLTFGPKSGLYRSSNHHMMVCTNPNIIRLDNLSLTAENKLWTTIQNCRDEFRAQTGAKRILIAVNDGAAACQSVPQLHIHILSLDLPSLKTSFAEAVARDLPSGPVPKTPALSLTSSFQQAACKQPAKPAAPHHIVTTGSNEQTIWQLQRPLRNMFHALLGPQTGFSLFMESTPHHPAEIHLIPRQPGQHKERSLTDIVRRHYLGLPYVMQEPVKNFLRNHPAAAQTFLRLRRVLPL